MNLCDLFAFRRVLAAKNSGVLREAGLQFRHLIAAIALLLAAAGPAHADFSGKVIAVLDGDTIDVLVNQRPVRVRLAQIDAPEKRQPWGSKSKEALSTLVFGKTVTVVGADTDRYGRTLGTVYVEGSFPGVVDAGYVNANAYMVQAGMAWAYRQYLLSRALLDTEAQARKKKRGLWADPSPVAPWEWRAAARGGGR